MREVGRLIRRTLIVLERQKYQPCGQESQGNRRVGS